MYNKGWLTLVEWFIRVYNSALLACLYDQNKSGFLKTSDWIDKGRPSKKATFVLIM